jgi:putative transposase
MTGVIYQPPTSHNRQSIRLKGYDYSRPGAYFVTLCVQNREALFGEIKNGKMQLNEFGIIVQDKWQWLPNQYLYVKLDEFVIMPNHLHGIIWIRDLLCKGGSRTAPTATSAQTTPAAIPTTIKPLGRLVGAFKTVSAKHINIARNAPSKPVWQRDFYDHIDRDEKELNRIRQYIRDNPLNWDYDKENPECKSPRHVTMRDPQGRNLNIRFLH